MSDDDPGAAGRRRAQQRAERRARRKRRIAALGAGAWRMFPFRGRFMTASVAFVIERLPDPPETWSAADVAMLCLEADRTLDLETPCDPAETVDLLTSRGLAAWTGDGFVKTGAPRAKRPRA